MYIVDFILYPFVLSFYSVSFCVVFFVYFILAVNFPGVGSIKLCLILSNAWAHQEIGLLQRAAQRLSRQVKLLKWTAQRLSREATPVWRLGRWNPSGGWTDGWQWKWNSGDLSWGANRWASGAKEKGDYWNTSWELVQHKNWWLLQLGLNWLLQAQEQEIAAAQAPMTAAAQELVTAATSWQDGTQEWQPVTAAQTSFLWCVFCVFLLSLVTGYWQLYSDKHEVTTSDHSQMYPRGQSGRGWITKGH